MNTVEVTLHNVKAVEFAWTGTLTGCRNLLAVPKQPKHADELDFQWELEAKTGKDFKRAELVLEDSGIKGKWWAVYCEDCYDPIMAVTQADDPEDAIDNISRRCAWLEVVASDYGTQEEFDKACDKGLIGFSGCGVCYDNETVRCVEIIPEAVHF